jgi:hypothetical protein
LTLAAEYEFAAVQRSTNVTQHLVMRSTRKNSSDSRKSLSRFARARRTGLEKRLERLEERVLLAGELLAGDTFHPVTEPMQLVGALSSGLDDGQAIASPMRQQSGLPLATVGVGEPLVGSALRLSDLLGNPDPDLSVAVGEAARFEQVAASFLTTSSTAEGELPAASAPADFGDLSAADVVDTIVALGDALETIS